VNASGASDNQNNHLISLARMCRLDLAQRMFPRLPRFLAALCVALASIQAQATSLTNLQSRLDTAWQVAEDQAERVITHIETVSAANGWDPVYRYPVFTENEALADDVFWADGDYRFNNRAQPGTGWADGAWPAWLWQLYAAETDPVDKAFWETKARAWSGPMLEGRRGDMLFAYLLPTRIWLEQAAVDAAEEVTLRNWIINGATQMIQPFGVDDRNRGFGNWLDTLGPYEGAYGYWRKADASDNQRHFHIFIDHMVTTQLMCHAADLMEASDPATAQELRRKAISHVRTVAHHSGNARLIYDSSSGTGTAVGMNRREGTWQRGYFSYDPVNPDDPSAYLWSEPKQGWNGWSTWSRGHAWYSYGCALTYYHTGDPHVREVMRDAFDFFIRNLPGNQVGEPHYEAGIYVPKWDFDYAKDVEPHTRYDTSAAAIFLAGLVKVLQVLPVDDPDWVRYYETAKDMFVSLTSSEFLVQATDVQMSILKQGDYHDRDAYWDTDHYNNGLIWGDTMFVQAMADFREWMDAPAVAPTVQLAVDGSGLEVVCPVALPDHAYQVEMATGFTGWGPHGAAQSGAGAEVRFSVPQPDAIQPRLFYRVTVAKER